MVKIDLVFFFSVLRNYQLLFIKYVFYFHRQESQRLVPHEQSFTDIDYVLILRVHCKSTWTTIDERSQALPTAKNFNRLQLLSSHILHISLLGSVGRCMGCRLQFTVSTRWLLNISSGNESKIGFIIITHLCVKKENPKIYSFTVHSTVSFRKKNQIFLSFVFGKTYTLLFIGSPICF